MGNRKHISYHRQYLFMFIVGFACEVMQLDCYKLLKRLFLRLIYLQVTKKVFNFAIAKMKL